MQEDIKQFDFWYAAENTTIVRPPSKTLETFGSTLVNYHLVAELADNPHKVRIREGRLEAHRPAIITPERFAQDELQGFGEEARRYYDFLKQNEDSVRILQYGYNLKQEAFSEQIVTDSVKSVLERVVESVNTANDPFAVVIKGVDNPWDVCLVKFFWMAVNASAPVNVRELEAARQREMMNAVPRGVQSEIETAFQRAEKNPSLINALGTFLRSKGVFEQYQDRFFNLIRRG